MGKCYSGYTHIQTDSYVNNCYSVGAYSISGQTSANENSYSICLSFPNHESYSFFAVFQGFLGKDASQYLVNNLANMLNELDMLDNDQRIIDCISKMDDEFLQFKNANINNSGCTFAFALIQHPNNNISSFPSTPISANISSTETTQSSILQPVTTPQSTDYMSTLKLPNSSKDYKCRIFWVGDCRAIIIKKHGKYFQSLTTDHSYHLCTQIEHKTELLRCFGYHLMKNNKNKYGQQKMKCIAECKQFSFGRNQTLMLFSSGLTECWYDNQMVKYYNTIYQKHRNEENTMTDTLRCLIKKCMHDNGSKEPISAVAIKFQ